MATAYGIPQAEGHWPTGWTVLHVRETGSTNADLLALAAPGGPAEGADRVALVADHQTAGRGRLDRRWEAPEGVNLLVSLLYRDVPVHVHELTQRLALAVAEACRTVAGVEATLKWPNDLLVGDRKLAGILAQAGVVAGAVDHVVVGLGLNVGWAPWEAVCLDEAGEGPVDRLALLAEILAADDRLATGGGVAAAYRAHLGTLGRRVRVQTAAGDVEGTAIGVEDDGRLVVLDACAVSHRIDTGDVVHLRDI